MIHTAVSGMQREPPGADPHAGWCGRGRGEPVPLPDSMGGRLETGPRLPRQPPTLLG